MNQTTYNKSQRSTSSSRRAETRSTYNRRRAAALGLIAVGALIAGKVVPAEYQAITGTTVADRLAQPFDQAQADLNKGQFSSGEVREVALPNVNQPAYDDALALTGSNASESHIDEVYRDIAAQQGDRPMAASPVIVPKADLKPGLQK